MNNCLLFFDSIDLINEGKKIALFYNINSRENWCDNYKITVIQKLRSVKVYAIKSNCDLQVHPGILKGVHLSKQVRKKDPSVPEKWK